MEKKGFSWKSLFINEDGTVNNDVNQSKSESVEIPKSGNTTTKFPNSNPGSASPANTNQGSASTQGSSISAEVLNSIIGLYETGFDSLNKPGYDFFEFYKAIQTVNSSDPSVYKMALSMAKGIDSTVSKERLLSEATFYIDEINKVFKQYEGSGLTKKSKLQESYKTTKESLNAEISSLERKIIEIQNQISTKKNELSSLDSTLLSEIEVIDQKLLANTLAKEKISDSINSVVNGIKTNI